MSRLRRFVRFGGVGLGGVVVQLTVITALTHLLHLHYAVATPLAVATAIVHNFAWHRHWTWRDRAGDRSLARTFAAFVMANGLVSLVGNQAVMMLLVGHFGLPPVPSNLVAIGACTVANFALADIVVFTARSVSSPATPPE